MRNGRTPAYRILLAAIAVAAIAAPSFAESPKYFKSSDGLRIYYRVEGTGEPVLLLHGFLVTSDANWHFPGIVRDLAPEYQVITFDHRGHGKSDKPESPDSYGQIMVEDAVALLDHLGVERAHVVGYSMGGLIALKLASDHPERVRSALIGGMGWVGKSDGSERMALYEPERFPNRALWACFVRFNEFGLTREEVEAIVPPGRLVVGQHDLFLRLLSIEPLRRMRPDWEHVIVPEATHMTCIFQPEFKQAIRDFLSEVGK